MTSFAALLEAAERRPLLGWDLSYDGRITFTPPWDFDAVVDARIDGKPDLLDMGTGGGEWLSRRPFPRGRTVATESWAPNLAVAQTRLAPLGVSVVAVVGAPDNVDQPQARSLPTLPFADAAFHLVINRHESFVAAEVARILAPGGLFLTQQVAAPLDAPFRDLLGAAPGPAGAPWTLAAATQQLGGSGLEITEHGDGAAVLRFADVGALAWYLIHVPWVMPGFRAADHLAGLERLHERTDMAVEQPMFWLAAWKPG